MKCRIGSPKLIYVWIQICSVWFVWELLFVIWSILDLLGCNVNRMAIFCVFIIVSLIAVIVTHSFYKHIEYKKEKERFRQFLTNESKKIKNVVAEILSFGGLCSQTDADGWRGYKDTIKYIRNARVSIICTTFTLSISQFFLLLWLNCVH